MARMREFYVNEVAPALNKKFGYKSVMQIPKLDKIVVNVGCGEARDNQKMIDAIMGDIAAITGQKNMEAAKAFSASHTDVPYYIIGAIGAAFLLFFLFLMIRVIKS